MEEGFYTVEQAAQMLGVHPRTVYRWCRTGKLADAVLKYGSRKFGFRIPARSVVEVMEVHPYVKDLFDLST